MTWRPGSRGSVACCRGSCGCSNVNRERRARTQSFRARTLWRRLATFGSADGAGSTPQKRVQRRASRCRGIVQGRGGVLKKLKAGRYHKDGVWHSEPAWHAECRHVGAFVESQGATKAGWNWCDVVHEVDDSRASQWQAQRVFLTFFGR